MKFFRVCLWCILVCCGAVAQAQMPSFGKIDSSNVKLIQITRADFVDGFKDAAGKDVQKLIGNVQIVHDGNTMNCDSALLSQQSNSFEAWGNVSIVQPDGSTASGDYLRYTGNSKTAFMQGSVSLSDGQSTLWTEELDYNMATKIGNYYKGGTLLNKSTTLSSETGNYNLNTKNALFVNNVVVNDPEFNIVSDKLSYNTNSKVVTFLAPSIISNAKSTIYCQNGTYDSKNEIALFDQRARIINENQLIEGNNLYYNKKTGYGKASGQVVISDTVQRITIFSGFADYNEKTRSFKAYIDPVMLMRSNGDKDSLFYKADTFFAAPVIKRKTIGIIPDTLKTAPADSLKRNTSIEKPAEAAKSKKNKKKDKGSKDATITIAPTTNIVPVDTIDANIPDSLVKRYFIGYHNVRIFSDSLQGVADSLYYSQQDSILRLYKDPILWKAQTQLKGDTMYLHTVHNKLRKVDIMGNAFMIQKEPKGPLYNQVKGKYIDAHLDTAQRINDMLVRENAECIYYAKDDNGAYLGVNKSESARIKVFFKNNEVIQVKMEENIDGGFKPLGKVDPSELLLKDFKWILDRRPKSRAEFGF